MRVSLEIFSIPEEARDVLRRAVYDSYERFLHRNNSKESETTLSIRSGTCPLSGKTYMNVVVQAPQAIDLPSLNLFTDSVYAAHPLREEDVVRNHRFVKIEDGPASNGNGCAGEDWGEESLAEGEIACWICGRFDGEEYRDYLTDEAGPLEVRMNLEAQVPLCVVCARILHRPSSIE